MIPFRSVSLGINCWSILLLLSSSYISCQRDGSDFDYRSSSSPSSSSGERLEGRLRVDDTGENNNGRFKSPTTKQPVRIQLSTSPSLLQDYFSGDERSSSTLSASGTIFRERFRKVQSEKEELPMREERTFFQNERVSSSQIFSSSQDGTTTTNNNNNNRNDRSEEENDPEVSPPVKPARSQGPKKSRTTRPPTTSTTTFQPPVRVNTRPSYPKNPDDHTSDSSIVPKTMKKAGGHHKICGENITLTTLTTTIVSPGWRENQTYPPHSGCIWIIKVMNNPSYFNPRETAIRVRIKHLEIEQEGKDCPYDYLEIIGFKKFCGFMQNKEYVFNSSSLLIAFHSDSNNEDTGFELELFAYADECTPEIMATNAGEVTSPGYPKKYPDLSDCWTLINADELANSVASRSGAVGPVSSGSVNMTISVTFDFIELESDDKCNFDFVEFWEVDSLTKNPTKSLGKFCDEKSIRKAEKTVAYNLDPRVTLNQQSRPSESAVESSSSSSALAPSPGFINENQRSREIINTKGPYLLVHFKSDNFLSGKGFRANYKVMVADLSRASNSDCNWAADESTQSITSPQYPNPYPPSKDCSLILRSPRTDQRIILYFETFQMEVDANCTFDRLEIYDDYDPSSLNGHMVAKKPVKTFCGRKANFKYLSGGPMIKLRFVSDPFQEHQGFSARYKFIQGESVQSSTTSQPYQPRPLTAFNEVPRNASIVPGSSHLLNCLPSDLGYQPQAERNHNNNREPSNSQEHREIDFNLNHGNNRNTNIQWFRDNRLITEGLAENGTKLLIREFSKVDVGRYTCKYGSSTADAWLDLANTDCRIVFRKRPKDVSLSEGELKIFECEAISPSQSQSKVTITWVKDGQKLTTSSRVEILKKGYLTINEVTYEDSGHYFCVARLQDDPTCTSQSAARLDVSKRVNVRDICGKPNLELPINQRNPTDSLGKIVGGTDAKKGAYPWQVMFWDIKGESFCGGALINERWIASAAHCFSQTKYGPPPPPRDNIVVRLGKVDQGGKESSEFNTRIQEIIKHPDYNADNFDNDLALIRVRDHVEFSDYIKPVCIGESRSFINEIFFKDNERIIKTGHVTGWGRLREAGPQSRFLREIQLPLIDHSTCQRATFSKMTINMFCAGYAQEVVGDACQGDSGGPLVSKDSDRWYLLGIVSWGEGCGRTGKYGYYTKVANYIDWIEGIIKN